MSGSRVSPVSCCFWVALVAIGCGDAVEETPAPVEADESSQRASAAIARGPAAPPVCSVLPEDACRRRRDCEVHVVPCADNRPTGCPVQCRNARKRPRDKGDDRPACEYDDVRYELGDRFAAADGCNTCRCTASGVACTQRACSTCEYDNVRYKLGDRFAAADGCNTCRCTASGVACTQRACADCAGLGKADCSARTDCQLVAVACTSAIPPSCIFECRVRDRSKHRPR